MTKIRSISIGLAILLILASCDSEQYDETVVYPDSSTKEFKQFAKQCSSCHKPPMPNAHTAKAWEAVMARMQLHKQERGQAMNDVERMQVLAYLQSHSKQE